MIVCFLEEIIVCFLEVVLDVLSGRVRLRARVGIALVRSSSSVCGTTSSTTLHVGNNDNTDAAQNCNKHVGDCTSIGCDVAFTYISTFVQEFPITYACFGRLSCSCAAVAVINLLAHRDTSPLTAAHLACGHEQIKSLLAIMRAQPHQREVGVDAPSAPCSRRDGEQQSAASLPANRAVE